MIDIKILLIIVEGESDSFFYREYLAGFLEEYPLDMSYHIKIINGDILTANSYEKLKEKLLNSINTAADENKFELEQIKYVAQICDIDGSYLTEGDFEIDQKDTISGNDTYKYSLSNHRVYTIDLDQKERLIGSWSRKKKNILSLLEDENPTKKQIDYRLYYNSLFLEHFLSDEIPRTSIQKRDKVDEFLNQYETIQEFEKFLSNKALSEDYKQSWELLESLENKMISTTNLNILFNDLRKL